VGSVTDSMGVRSFIPLRTRPVVESDTPNGWAKVTPKTNTTGDIINLVTLGKTVQERIGIRSMKEYKTILFMPEDILIRTDRLYNLREKNVFAITEATLLPKVGAWTVTLALPLRIVKRAREDTLAFSLPTSLEYYKLTGSEDNADFVRIDENGRLYNVQMNAWYAFSEWSLKEILARRESWG